MTGRLDGVSDDSSLSRYRRKVDDRLNELLPPLEEPPERLHEAMRYSALAPGKRLRPAICMATALAAGGSEESGLDAGCAIELVHCFSLIHDDLPAIDDDELRRGRPTCHVQFGEALAILAGDALFALAFEVLSECSDDPVKVGKAVRILAKTTGSMGLVGGEVLDIEAEGGGGSLDLLQTIHARKTGALIGASCEIGACLAGGSDEVVGLAGDFGRAVGLAFQIADDILNETSTPEQLGKAVGSDRELQKLTYPGLLGLDESKARAEKATQEAMELLEQLPGDRSELRGLAEYAIARTW